MRFDGAWINAVEPRSSGHETLQSCAEEGPWIPKADTGFPRVALHPPLFLLIYHIYRDFR